MNRIRKMHGEITLAGHPTAREDVDCSHCLPGFDLGGAIPSLPGASS